MVTSYDYNSRTPRFFSKAFIKIDQGKYDVPLATAVAASSSAPVYFDPKVVEDAYNFETSLVDGGIICNNPSLYGY